MADCVRNPAIPYIGSIPQGAFLPYKILRIQGTVPDSANRFNINLQCGSRIYPPSDVAVQVSVCFVDGFITLNSLRAGTWGEEQRGILLIQCSQNFEIILSCDVNQYKVTINGEHYCQFPQRIHYSRITHLVVDGDVSISCISYETSTPEAASAPPPPLAQNEDNDFELINTSNAPLLKKQPINTYSDSSQPPSYDIAVSGQPPYPTSTVPGAPGVAPMHAGTPSGTSAFPYLSTSRSDLLPAPPGIHPPPPVRRNYQPRQPPHNATVPLNAPVPLNSPLSRVEPVNGVTERKIGRMILGMIGVLVAGIVMIVIVVSFQKKHSNKYDG